MGEEVKMSEYETRGEDKGEEERVREWEMGLPSVDDLTPLSQPLIPPELASAFSISPEPYRTLIDVHRASRSTLLSLRGGSSSNNNNNNNNNNSNNNNFKSFTDDDRNGDDPIVVEEEDDEDSNSDTDRVGGSESRKLRKLDGGNEEADDQSAKTVKRPRLVWNPQLHKRFVDVVGHLGIKIAVPKTIMQLMNVEGLTRENVASHLQKYRLYLKRMQGGSSAEGLSSSDQLLASTPVPQSLQDSGGGGGMQMMQVPVYGHHLGMQMGNQYHHHRPRRHHGGFEASSYKYYPQHNDNEFRGDSNA